MLGSKPVENAFSKVFNKMDQLFCIIGCRGSDIIVFDGIPFGSAGLKIPGIILVRFSHN